MAPVVTTQVLVDGSINKCIKVNIQGDVTTELVNFAIFDASLYTNPSIENKLMKIDFCLNNFSAKLSWGATANVPLINLEKDISEEMDFLHCGGLINNALAAGKTGNILITTNGLISSSNEGYIIFHIKSRDVSFPT